MRCVAHDLPGSGRSSAVYQSPLSLARAHVASSADGKAEGSAAHLVVLAGQPWRPQTHNLFPAWARTRAVELLRIGFQLFKRDTDRFREPVGLFDLWIDRVMPFDICRRPTDGMEVEEVA